MSAKRAETYSVWRINFGWLVARGLTLAEAIREARKGPWESTVNRRQHGEAVYSWSPLYGSKPYTAEARALARA